jgi:hypothetical protein
MQIRADRPGKPGSAGFGRILPYIAALSTGGDIVAFENPEQELSLYDTATGAVTTTAYVLQSGTSPSITLVP